MNGDSRHLSVCGLQSPRTHQLAWAPHLLPVQLDFYRNVMPTGENIYALEGNSQAPGGAWWILTVEAVQSGQPLSLLQQPQAGAPPLFPWPEEIRWLVLQLIVYVRVR